MNTNLINSIDKIPYDIKFLLNDAITVRDNALLMCLNNLEKIEKKHKKLLEENILLKSGVNTTLTNSGVNTTPSMEKCKKVLKGDYLIDIIPYKRKIKDTEFLMTNIKEKKIGENMITIYTNVMKSKIFLIMNEYYMNNLIAENNSTYKCDKILN